MEFTTLSGAKVTDVVSYIKDYLDKNGEEFYIEVVVGCDSQNRKRHTNFATVIFLHKTSYESGMGKGGVVLWRKEQSERKHVKTEVDRRQQRKLRLLAEAQKSIETATHLNENGIKVEYIDLDLNPLPQYKSNEVLDEARGWAQAMGYNVRIKPDAISASYAADKVAKW